MDRPSILDRWVAGRGRKIVVGVAILALLALPIANVFASHAFTDVPTSSPYHDAISAIANAGITGGCGGSKYCPKGLVTREQMAVFLDRLGNLRNEKGPVVDALTVLGQLIFADVEDFTLADNTAHECETSTNEVPIVPDEVFSYSVVHQLRKAPIATNLVNVQIDDEDLTDGTYKVCFRTVDNTALTPGTYSTYYTAGITIGSGVFADASVSRARFSAAFKD